MKKIIFLISCTLVMISCTKKQELNESADIAQQNAVAESSSTEISVMVDQAAKGESSFSTYDADCITISYDTTNNMRLITIDFGTENCLCADGKNRRGKLLVSFEGEYNSIGNEITTSTEDYFVNDNQVEGTRITSFSSTDVYNIQADFTVTMSDGSGEATWSSTRVRTQTEGQSTPFVLTDNVYEITGTASGETVDRKDYELTIDQALEIQLGCFNIKSGIIKLSSSHLNKDAFIDYGDGTCDNKATLTYGNKSKEITL